MDMKRFLIGAIVDPLLELVRNGIVGAVIAAVLSRVGKPQQAAT